MKLVKLTQVFQVSTEDDGPNTTRATRPFWVNPEAVHSVRSRTEGSGTQVEFQNAFSVIVSEPAEEVVAMMTAT